jgi:hypothetical protein
MDKSLFPLLFLFQIIITFDFCLLNVNLLPYAQLDIFLISMLAWFSAPRTVSALTTISKSSAKAIAFVRLPYSRLISELYWIFQNAGTEHEPWGQFLFTSFSICVLFVLKIAVLPLK